MCFFFVFFFFFYIALKQNKINDGDLYFAQASPKWERIYQKEVKRTKKMLSESMYISYIYLVETDLYNVERARCRRREEKNCTNEKSYFEIVKTMFELAHTHSLIHKEYKNRERERENEKWRMSEKKLRALASSKKKN